MPGVPPQEPEGVRVRPGHRQQHLGSTAHAHCFDVDAVERPGQLADDRPEHGAVQIILGLEDAVDDEPRDARRLGDVVHRRAVEAALQERGCGSLDELGPPLGARQPRRH